MLDIKFIRENAEAVKENCQNRHVECDVDRLLELDEKRRKLTQEIEKLNGEKNKLNDEIKKTEDREEIIKKGKEVKEKLLIERS